MKGYLTLLPSYTEKHLLAVKFFTSFVLQARMEAEDHIFHTRPVMTGHMIYIKRTSILNVQLRKAAGHAVHRDISRNRIL